MKRICVQWPRFGPYHVARLNALHQLAAAEQMEVVGLETAGQERLYGWESPVSEARFSRVQVFHDRVFEDIPPIDMQKGVSDVLDRLQPYAVVINSYSFPDALACLKWCRKNRRVAVCASDSKADDAVRVRWRERVKSLLINQFDAALLAGTPHREYFLSLGFPAEHIYLGYDVVDNAYFREAAEGAKQAPNRHRDLPGLASDDPFFVACGRFIRKKNLEVLVRAYAAYRREHRSPWRLVLAGDGPQRSALEALITTLGVDGVTITGFRQIDELPAYYGLAGAFVHPAVNDQWGLVVNEAMASGLPVLVSQTTGCAHDLVKEGRNGFTFAYDDLESLTHLLRKMSSEDIDRTKMGRLSQQIIADWSLDRFAKQTVASVHSGGSRADRGMDPRVRLALWTLERASSSVSSFHTVEA